MTKRVRTPAIRALESAGIPFEPLEYRYAERGGTAHAASELDLDEHAVIKTLVFEVDDVRAVFVLMHGDRQVSTRALARALGVRQAGPCPPGKAEKITGYRVGGMSPFGSRAGLAVLIERGILDLDRIWLNAGRRGLLVAVDPRDVARALEATPVECAIDPGGHR